MGVPVPGPAVARAAGSAPLFEIEHVTWGVEVLGGVQGQRVVELGPLEGGHTYLLDRMGAAEVVAVEANTRGLSEVPDQQGAAGDPSARFLCGDALRYLEGELAREAPSSTSAWPAACCTTSSIPLPRST